MKRLTSKSNRLFSQPLFYYHAVPESSLPSKFLHPVAKNDTPLCYFCTEMLINTHPQTFEIWFGMSIFVRLTKSILKRFGSILKNIKNTS